MLQNYTIVSQVCYVNIGGVRTFINVYQSFGDNTIFSTTHPSLQIIKKMLCGLSGQAHKCKVRMSKTKRK